MCAQETHASNNQGRKSGDARPTTHQGSFPPCVRLGKDIRTYNPNDSQRECMDLLFASNASTRSLDKSHQRQIKKARSIRLRMAMLLWKLNT